MRHLRKLGVFFVKIILCRRTSCYVDSSLKKLESVAYRSTINFHWSLISLSITDFEPNTNVCCAMKTRSRVAFFWRVCFKTINFPAYFRLNSGLVLFNMLLIASDNYSTRKLAVCLSPRGYYLAINVRQQIFAC